MSSQQVSYKCEKCRYQNTWTRDEILRLGNEWVHKGQYVPHEYSLPCKNPARPRCNKRYVVKVSIWEE